MNNHAISIHSSPPIRRKLFKSSPSQNAEHRAVLQTNIILHAASGSSNEVMARTHGCTEKTARKWRDRFATRSDEKALKDKPRMGRSALVPASIRGDLVKLACKHPHRETAPFRKVRIASSLGQVLEHETKYHLIETEIRRVLNGADIDPHHIRMWLYSRDTVSFWLACVSFPDLSH